MKKIMSLLAVAAIVTGAFAFTPGKKGTQLCISTTFKQNKNCAITQAFTTPGTLVNFYDPTWAPGRVCNANSCPTQILVSVE